MIYLPRDATQSAVLLRQSRLSVCLPVTLRYPNQLGWNSSRTRSTFYGTRYLSHCCVLFCI